ncbi:MAG: hypothetical protein ABW092_05995 [Candidatus Thiodiazotropha sp.]
MDEEEKDKSLQDDLEKVARKQASESFGQVMGGLISPIAREIINLEEMGIEKIKSTIKSWRNKEFIEDSLDDLHKIKEQINEDPNRVTDIEKLHKVTDGASEAELENNDVYRLWRSLIFRIKDGDLDTDLLIEKLKEINTAEASFLLNFESERNRRLIVNPAIKALAYTGKMDDEEMREQELAISLKEKGLLEQPFPFMRVISSVLILVAGFLIMAETARDLFEQNGINISSANNVILIAVLGVFAGIMSLSVFKYPTRLTWIGRKLQKGGLSVEKKPHNKANPADAKKRRG